MTASGGVPASFDEVAGTYDLMVGLSPGYRAQLRASAGVLVDHLPDPGGRPLRVLDLGCGSGISTAALEQALETTGRAYEIIGVDGSGGMLARARRRRWRGRVRFVQDDAESLDPRAWGVEGEVFDGVLAAYLVRNVSARDHLLRRVHELMAPGAPLVVHEYSVKDSRLGRWTWNAVSWGVVIPLGVLTAPRSDIYRYLWRSVRAFDGAEELRGRLVRAGFTGVRSRTFPGWQHGVLHTFLAVRAQR